MRHPEVAGSRPRLTHDDVCEQQHPHHYEEEVQCAKARFEIVLERIDVDLWCTQCQARPWQCWALGTGRTALEQRIWALCEPWMPSPRS